MVLNEYGRIVSNEWMRTDMVRTDVISDAFVVMPNSINRLRGTPGTPVWQRKY